MAQQFVETRRPHCAVHISVVVQAYNSEKTIAECLARVVPFVDEAIVVVGCDASDRTAAIAIEYGATVVRSDAEPSLSEHREKGVLNTSTCWTATIDVDDRLSEDDMCSLRDRLATPSAQTRSASVQCNRRLVEKDSGTSRLVEFQRSGESAVRLPEPSESARLGLDDAAPAPGGIAQPGVAENGRSARETRLVIAGEVVVPSDASTCCVDVIILSYCQSRVQFEMTKQCIRSLRRSERDIRFNVVVVETNSPEAMRAFSSGPLFDDDCRVVFPQREFNYNEFLQIGFQQLDESAADYLLIANNDVVFEEHFAAALIKGLSFFDSVSPWCPRYHERLFDSSSPYHAGYRVRHEVCGWAIMFHKRLLRRVAFEDLFPRDFAFWFQDDYYAHQLAHVGARHALVTAARVAHLFEQSHNLIDPERRGPLTAGAERIFREKTAEIDTQEQIPSAVTEFPQPRRIGNVGGFEVKQTRRSGPDEQNHQPDDCILLTIAVLSIPSRLRDQLPLLFGKLNEQAEGKPVEIIALLDNRKSTIGRKRNAATSIARGDYVVFVDDDDDVAEDYVDSLLDAIDRGDQADCIVFDAWVTWNGNAGKLCRYGIEYEDEDRADAYYRQPNHICCFRTEVARRVPYEDVSWHEDFHWAKAIRPHLHKQVRVERVLYHYRCDPQTSAADWPEELRARKTQQASPAATAPISPQIESPNLLARR